MAKSVPAMHIHVSKVEVMIWKHVTVLCKRLLSDEDRLWRAALRKDTDLSASDSSIFVSLNAKEVDGKVTITSREAKTIQCCYTSVSLF